MLEKIYTIPVNEAFDACRDDASRGCPICVLRKRLENDELEIIMGASMMEPDIRIKTNEQGFCGRHFDMMLERNNRLGLALILESHLAEVRNLTEPGGFMGARTAAMPEKLDALEKSCYVCGRINYSLGKMIENTVYLWESEKEFRDKLDAQPYFCLPHFRALLVSAKANVNKKKLPDFQTALAKVVNGYFDELSHDISWFCKKFDYRYENEPWGNSKDSPERAVRFLSSERSTKPDKPKK
ncbi:MAG: hypothetical protein IKB34_07155 [Clostridia bacterium]|nr:hypothetical protein [Clostridia bacterium]